MLVPSGWTNPACPQAAVHTYTRLIDSTVSAKRRRTVGSATGNGEGGEDAAAEVDGEHHEPMSDAHFPSDMFREGLPTSNVCVLVPRALKSVFSEI